MYTDTTLDTALTVEAELHGWRGRALDGLLTVVVITAAPLIVINFVHAVASPNQWPAALTYLGLYLCTVGLRVFRQLDTRVRAWGLVLLGYAVGALALAFGGLAGDGRVILVAVPMLALVLIGGRSGLMMTVPSLLIFAGFAFTAHRGWMADWLLIPGNPLDLDSWLYEGIVVGMCLAMLITLQGRLHLFLKDLVVEKTQLLETDQRSRMLYQTITQLTSDFAYVVRVEPDGKVVNEWLPEGFTSITGYTPGEVSTPDKWANLIHPDDVPAFRQCLQTLLSGQSCVSELCIRAKSGELRWLRVYGHPISDQAREQVIRICGAVQDITHHRQADEALEKRVAQLTLLNDIGGRIAEVLELDALQDRAVRLVQEGFGYHHVGLFLVDSEQSDLVMKARAGDFAHLFPCEHRIGLGHGMVGWVGSHGEELLANDVRAEPRYVNFFPDVIPTQSELSVPLTVGGKTVGVLDVQSPRLSAFDENDVMVLQTLADQVAVAIENARLYERAQQELIECQQAEEALQESEEMARAILNATTESVLLIDDQGTILALNQTAAQRFGRTEDELVGLCSQDMLNLGLMSLGLAGSRKAWARQVVRSGKPIRFEDERGGIVFDSSIYPVFDARGKVTQLAIFARDVTARKRAEQQAARAERLAAMGRLTASLAHEINNPLQVIRNNLELVQDFDLDADECEARLDIMRSEIDRLAGVCRRVLDFARPPDVTRHTVSIAPLVTKTLALISKQLEQAAIEVTTDCPTELPPVLAAPEQITQLLLNLAINAIEAMSEGGHLHIAARVDGDMLAISMTNDGSPIPEENIERIFEPFFTTKPEGTGLGLSICHSIVQQHGGTIRVENLEDGEGVTLITTLPIAGVAEGQEY